MTKNTPPDKGANIVKTPEDLLADERMAKYMRRQKLLLKFVKTKLGKALLGKKLFKHEDILKQKDELFNNLFGDRLDKVNSRYVDAMFLSYSKRQNKSKKPDDLCMKKIYEYSSKKLQRTNYDIAHMQVDISDTTENDEESVFITLPEYLNLLENIRVEFKKVNADYEQQAKSHIQMIDAEDICTEFQANLSVDEIRSKKIEICAKDYDTIVKNADIDPEFSELCMAFYLAFKASKQLDPLKKILSSDMQSAIVLDDIFLDDVVPAEGQKKTIPLEYLFKVFEKLMKENSPTMHLRAMYDIS